MTKKDRKHRIALVGNAPLEKDFSSVIDGCDYVVRCNEAKNLGPFSGKRTDVLCITNTGAPAIRMMREKSVQKQPKFPNLKEVWFPRNYQAHKQHNRGKNPEFYSTEFDRSRQIIWANKLHGINVNYFRKSFNESVFSILKKYGIEDFVSPSTGFLAFMYILSAKRWNQSEKIVLGFTFETWSGHPSEAEKLIMHDLIKSRGDVVLHE